MTARSCLIPEWTRTIPPAGSVPLKFWIFAPAPS